MRPPRLLLLLVCFISFPIILTAISHLSADPRSAEPVDASTASGPPGWISSFFSFHGPSSLFPPSAIISLTDDNSTFFLARPAAFGPLLPSDGLSGPLWIGSGFGDDTLRKGGVTVGAEGELGCSDVPGWDDRDKTQKKEYEAEDEKLKSGGTTTNAETGSSAIVNDKRSGKDTSGGLSDGESLPEKGDGTDDHLHQPLTESEMSSGSGTTANKGETHADIQSLQETAEITGKVVLLSRGGCGFLEKVKWAQRRGGIAVIVGDNTRGGGLVTMYARGDTSNVTIPALFTSHTTAHLLSSLMPSEKGGDGDGVAKLRQPPSQTPSEQTKGGKSANGASKSTPDPPKTTGRSGILRSLLSLLGFSKDNPSHGPLQEDSRRPPSSGNIDWVVLDPFSDDEASTPPKGSNSNGNENDQLHTSRSTKPFAKPTSSPQSGGDDFVIGVQDWRDPDVAAPPVASTAKSATASAKGSSKTDVPGRGSHSSGDGLKGGSITPGSGEYPPQGRQQKGPSDPNDKQHGSVSKPQGDESTHRTHWWSLSFGSGHKDGGRDGSHAPPNAKSAPKASAAVKPATTAQDPGSGNEPPEHEGLWVTLSPATMSSSPFFDTLLVLVISPLVTLTVVYALLLLRSRIRRRRWRAPKAVVNQLPVRTYHTISSRSPTPRARTPRTSSPSSPLLSRSRSPNGRRRSHTFGSLQPSSPTSSRGAERSSHPVEKNGTGSRTTLARRRYTGRQVECVVCLEEYIDGQSQVMSLPCGHEFHVECITPWLTTRRRTCPICKGDVVRSLDRSASFYSDDSDQDEATSDDLQDRIAGTRNDSPSSAIPVPQPADDDADDGDLERGETSQMPLLGSLRQASPQAASWRNLASLSLSALSGDSVWHQPRQPRADRNR